MQRGTFTGEIMRFLDALQEAKAQGHQVVIPDIKVYSPKDGDLMRGRNPVDYARSLEVAGAPVLSVVTEEKEFHGSLSMLRSISEAVQIPVLRKDFIHTREDLEETVACGASAILLMCSCLEPEEMKYLYHEALALGLDPFVETHKAEDFQLVKDLGLNPKLMGINNRDILVLERDDGDVKHTLSLVDLAPEEAFLVTESSIKNPSEVRSAINSGMDAALVGTAIALAPDAENFYRMLTGKRSLKVCGVMHPSDAEICVSEGVDRIGFVVEYPLEVPWNLTVEQAKAVRTAIPAGFQACMVTGGSVDKILGLAREIRPNLVQLHYKENLEDTKILCEELGKLGIGVIKTVPVSTEACQEQFGTDDYVEIAGLLSQTDVAGILVDPRHGKDIARKNLEADQDLFQVIQKHASKPVILAGGLKLENLEVILEKTGAVEVDVMNGSEDAPGKKNREKIQKMVEIVRG